MIRRLVVVAVILAGCRSEAAPAPGLASGPADSAQASVGGAATFAELVPGDTAAVISIMRRTMQEIDGALAGYVRRDTTLEAVKGKAPRTLSVWLEQDIPRKLTVSEPNESGRMLGESNFWFVQGELRVAQQPEDSYAFDADRIIVWTDPSLVPIVDITPELRMQREHEVVEQARQWLNLVGVKLP